MGDPRYNLEMLDHLDVPDLWPGIEHQDVDSGSTRRWASTVVGDPSARRRFTSAIVALVVAVAGTLLVVRALSPLGSHPGNASSWPGGTNVLSIPPAGTAIPAFLADGSPVFVVTTQQAQTHVLSAVSTHNP